MVATSVLVTLKIQLLQQHNRHEQFVPRVEERNIVLTTNTTVQLDTSTSQEKNEVESENAHQQAC